MTDETTTIDAPGQADAAEPQTQVRDYEAEAREMGWTGKDEFKGDEARWVDAETFVKRGEEMMPILKAQNKKLRAEMAEMRRDLKKASQFFENAEKRGYERALADIEKRHEEAVEVGDTAAAKRAVDDMRKLEKDFAVKAEDASAEPDPATLRRELDTWVADNDWYVLDEKKRAYADMQANVMGLAKDWPGGQKAWLDELGKRVERRFAETKPVPVSTGGNRSAPGSGGRTFADLPPEAKKLADKWVKSGIIKSRDDYVKSYQW